MKDLLTLEKKGKKRTAESAVILTSYNRDWMLKRSISSVLDQSLEDIILLVIDDNSTNPETLKTIKEFNDPRMYFFQTATTDEQRKQISTFARNINYMLQYILSNLSVNYVCYLPCDDYFELDKLQIATKYLSSTGFQSCWNLIKTINNKGDGLGYIPGDHTRRNIISNPVTVLDHGSIVHTINIVKKLKKPHFWPLNKKTEAIAPDGEFFQKLVNVGGPIRKCSPRILGYKTQHSDSIQGRANGW